MPLPRHKPGAWAACLVAGIVAAALFAGSVPQSPPAAPAAEQGVRAVAVRTGALATTIRVTGSTAAADGVMLRAPYLRGNRSRGSAGDFNLELSQLVEPGRYVREGDIVAVFDNENMRVRLDNDEADVAQAEATVKRLRADHAAKFEEHEQKIRVARADVERAVLDLKTSRVRSSIDAQKFALTLEEARATVQALTAETAHLRARQSAELRAAELELERAAVDARRAKANLDRLTVRAPIDGLMVAEQIYRFGQFGQIRQGDQLRPGQPYVRIANLSRMIVEGVVNQVDATDLRFGQPVAVRFDAYPDLELPGRVERIGAMARSIGARANYVADIPLIITLEAKDPRVIPGLTVHGDVQVASVEGAIVPRRAIFYDDDRAFAFVRTPAGWDRRELEIGLTNHVQAAVRSGVAPGESVALEPLALSTPR